MLKFFRKNKTQLSITVCPQTCTGNRPCIRKCCSLDKIYSFGFTPGRQRGCLNPGTEYLKPKFYSDYSNPVSDTELENIPLPHFIEKYPSSFKYECPGNRTVFFVFPRVADIMHNTTIYSGFSAINFRIRKDGNILFRYPDGRCKVINTAENNVCIDGVMNFENRSDSTHVFDNREDEIVMFICTLPANEEVRK